MIGQGIDQHEAIVAQVGDAALEMENAGHGANIDTGAGEALACQDEGKLPRTLLVRARRYTDEEVAVCLADITAVDGAGWQDGVHSRIEAGQRVADGVNLAGTAGRPWTCEDGSPRSE